MWSVPARPRCTMGGTRYAGPSGSTRPRPPPVPKSRYIKATADYHSRKFAQEHPEAAERRRPVMAPPQAETRVSAQGAGGASRPPRPPNKRVGHGAVCPGSGRVRQAASRGAAPALGCLCWWCPAIVYVLDGVRGKQHPCGHRRQHL